MIERYYDTSSIIELPYSSLSIDFPLNVIGRWGDVVRVPLALHDCGCGICVMILKNKPSTRQLERIHRVYDHVYIDSNLDQQLPKQSKGWSLFGQYKMFEKQYCFDDEDQKTAVYYCQQLDRYAMRCHYSDHHSCDCVLAYVIARIGLGARGVDRDNVISWCQVLQQYSIRARLKYAEMVDDIVGCEQIIDVPHVHLDEDMYYRFGTQRGKIAIQTTTNYLRIFECNNPDYLNCFVGSLPGLCLEDEITFNKFINDTKHLGTLKYSFKRV